MNILIKNGTIFAPEKIGKADILIVHNKIVKIAPSLSKNDFNLDLVEIDAAEKFITPGFIDLHTHIIGGGGEGGYKTMAPEIQPKDVLSAGVTTLIGLLGTDAIFRNVENLLAKSRSLKAHGITAYIMTGAYQYPSTTITGSVKKDIAFIDEVLGVKIAICDHRASPLDSKVLATLASDARVSGMLSGKHAFVTIHTGNAKEKLDVLFKTIEKYNTPISHYLPTHINRNYDIFNDAILFALKGGNIDITASPYVCEADNFIQSGAAILKALENGVNKKRITVSSDSNGTWSKYDNDGNVIEIGVSSIKDLYDDFKLMITKYNFTLEEALPYFTSNQADFLHLKEKGRIREKNDADILILKSDYNISSVISNGNISG